MMRYCQYPGYLGPGLPIGPLDHIEFVFDVGDNLKCGAKLTSF